MPFILAGAEDAAEGSGGYMSLILMALVIGALFYFLMVRPQRTRIRRHQELLSQLEVGDEVQTIGGIYGRIEHLDDESVVLQVEGGGRLRLAIRALAAKNG